MNFSYIKKLLKPLIFLIIGLIILYSIYHTQQSAYMEECAIKGITPENCSLFQKMLNDFYNTNVFWVVMVMLLFFISCFIRAVRWKMMLDTFGINTKWYNSLGAILIAYLANLAFPRAGEIVRAGVIIRYENINIDKTLGTIITDRVIDVICLGSVLILGLVFAFSDIKGYFTENIKITKSYSTFDSEYFWFLGLFIILAISIFTLYKFKEKIKANPLTKRIVLLVKGLWQGMLSVRNLQRPWAFIGYTISIWLIYFFMNYLMFKAFGPTENLGLKAALVVFIFGSLGILFPSPGGMGSYHYLVMESLTIFGVSGSDGFSFAMIAFFTIQIIAIVILGLAALAYMPLVNR